MAGDKDAKTLAGMARMALDLEDGELAKEMLAGIASKASWAELEAGLGPRAEPLAALAAKKSIGRARILSDLGYGFFPDREEKMPLPALAAQYCQNAWRAGNAKRLMELMLLEDELAAGRLPPASAQGRRRCVCGLLEAFGRHARGLDLSEAAQCAVLAAALAEGSGPWLGEDLRKLFSAACAGALFFAVLGSSGRPEGIEANAALWRALEGCGLDLSQAAQDGRCLRAAALLQSLGQRDAESVARLTRAWPDRSVEAGSDIFYAAAWACEARRGGAEAADEIARIAADPGACAAGGLIACLEGQRRIRPEHVGLAMRLCSEKEPADAQAGELAFRWLQKGFSWGLDDQSCSKLLGALGVDGDLMERLICSDTARAKALRGLSKGLCEKRASGRPCLQSPMMFALAEKWNMSGFMPTEGQESSPALRVRRPGL